MKKATVFFQDGMWRVRTEDGVIAMDGTEQSSTTGEIMSDALDVLREYPDDDPSSRYEIEVLR